MFRGEPLRKPSDDLDGEDGHGQGEGREDREGEREILNPGRGPDDPVGGSGLLLAFNVVTVRGWVGAGHGSQMCGSSQGAHNPDGGCQAAPSSAKCVQPLPCAAHKAPMIKPEMQLTKVELYTLHDIDWVAKYTGVPQSTLYRWRVDHKGPLAHKTGKKLMYRRHDVETWLVTRRDNWPDVA